MVPRKMPGFGYRRDYLDRRDFMFSGRMLTTIPEAVDLRQHCPDPMDQGQIGACTSHGITGALRATMIAAGNPDVALSRLQLYYDEREIEGTTTVDSGANIRDGIKCAASIGIANELDWPYHPQVFTQKPFPSVYKAALKFEALAYARVGNPDGTASAVQIKAAIASGYPVVGGFNVFEQFESDQCSHDGVVAMPGQSEQSIGGHCTYFPAFGQKPGYITGRNSWGSSWGDKGDFYISEQYLEQQGSDFWIITKVGKAVTA
jgi:C1A family cysteine protease